LKCISPQIQIDSLMSLKNITDKNKKEIQEYFEELNLKKCSKNHFIYCITHGALMFGNYYNKEYYNKKKISQGIFNVIHEHDPLPNLFYHLSAEFKYIRANNAIGNFRILKNNNNIIYTHDISHKDSEEVEAFFNTNKELSFNMIYNKLDTYKVPVNQGNSELDKIERINKDFEKLNKPYISTTVIGRGSFGVVVKAYSESNNKLFAIKRIKTKFSGLLLEALDNEENIIDKNTEIKNLLKVNNEHVVKLIDFFDFYKQKTYLVFEYCSDGSLHSYITKYDTKHFNESELRELSCQLLDGLSAIHSFKIIHRDIKPANILVTKLRQSLKNENLCYKISDLGSSIEYQGRLKLLTAEGTLLFMSPEVYLAYKNDELKVKINQKTDIFALGAVILFCKIRKIPWNEQEFDEELSKTNGFEKTIDQFVNRSDALNDMLISMLKNKSYERLSADTLLSHPFIKDDRVKVRYKIDEKTVEYTTQQPKKYIEIQKDSGFLDNKEVEKDIAEECSHLIQCIKKAYDRAKEGYYNDSITQCSEALKIATYLKENDGEEVCRKIVKKFQENESFLLLQYFNENSLEDFLVCICSMLASSYQLLGRYQEAVSEYKKLLQLYGKSKMSRLNCLKTSRTLCHMGGVFMHTFKHEEVLEHLKTSLAYLAVAWNIQNTDEFKKTTIEVKLDDIKFPVFDFVDEELLPGHWSVDTFQLLINFSQVYIRVKDLDKFFSFTKAAIKLMENHIDEFEMIHYIAVHVRIASVYLYTEDQKKESLDYILKVIYIIRSCYKGDPLEFPLNITHYDNIAKYYHYVTKDSAKAEEYYKKALELMKVIQKRNADPMYMACYHYNSGKFYLDIKDESKAIFHFKQVVEKGENEVISLLDDKKCIQQSYRILGQLLKSKYYLNKYFDTIKKWGLTGITDLIFLFQCYKDYITWN